MSHWFQKENLKYTLIFIIGVLLACYMFYSINEKYIARNNAAIESAEIKVELKLTRELEKIDLTLETIGVFFENSRQIPGDIYQEITAPFLEELYGIQYVLWAPAISSKTLNSMLVDKTDTLNFPDGIPDALKQTLAAGGSTVQYPVLMASPDSGETKLLGRDVYGYASYKAAINHTIGSRRMAYANTLIQDSAQANTAGFTTILSIYDSISINPKGLLLAEYDMNEFVEKTLRFEIPYLDIDIYDNEDPARPLYTGIQPGGESYPGENIEYISLKAGDRVWQVTMMPKVQFVTYPHAIESYFVLLLGIATSLLLIAVLRQRDNYSMRLKSEVKLRTAELEESNRLKENLLREIHHRVKNNLQIASSLMNMQKRKVSSPEAKAALEDSQNRILAIALTHQKIYQDKDTKAVNLNEYLNDLTSYQKKLYPSVAYNISCPELLIDLDKAVPLALITSELLINASKHAFPETSESDRLDVEVSCPETTTVKIVIRDNGVGLDKEFDSKQSSGLGFKIIHALCKQISARFSHSNDKGAVFEICFENKS